MNTSRLSKQLAALLIPLAASCAVCAQVQGGPSGGTVDLYGTGNVNQGQQAGQTDNAGNAQRTNESLDNLPPSAAGNTVDSAPSTINPDKGPHTLHRDRDAQPRDRYGNAIDPNVLNGAMDGEGLSGIPSRHNPGR